MGNEKRTQKPSEVGERIGVSGDTIVREIKRGELPGHQTPGNHWRVFNDDADRYVERMTRRAHDKK